MIISTLACLFCIISHRLPALKSSVTLIYRGPEVHRDEVLCGCECEGSIFVVVPTKTEIKVIYKTYTSVY